MYLYIYYYNYLIIINFPFVLVFCSRMRRTSNNDSTIRHIIDQTETIIKSRDVTAYTARYAT